MKLEPTSRVEGDVLARGDSIVKNTFIASLVDTSLFEKEKDLLSSSRFFLFRRNPFPKATQTVSHKSCVSSKKKIAERVPSVSLYHFPLNLIDMNYD